MSQRLLVALLVLLIAGSVAVPQAGAKPRRCVPKHSIEVARSSAGVAFRYSRWDDGLSVCRAATKRIVHLGEADEALTVVRMAGRFVALRDHYDSGAPDPCYSVSVRVFDLARKPDPGDPLWPIYDEARFNCAGDPHSEDYNLPTSIVLKGNGAVAYVRCFSIELFFGGPYRCSSSSPRQVIKHDAKDRRNRFTILDSGLAIATQSLRLTGGTLSWRNGQSARSARLR